MPSNRKEPWECYAIAFSDLEATWEIGKPNLPENGKVWVFTWIVKQREQLKSKREAETASTHGPDQHFSGLFFLFSFLSFLQASLVSLNIRSFTNLPCSSKATYMTGARAGGQMLAHCSHLSPASPAHLSVKKTWECVHAHTDSDHMLKSAQSSMKHFFSFVLSPSSFAEGQKNTDSGPSTSALKNILIAHNI